MKEAENPLIGYIIIIILNLLVFSTILIFVIRSTGGVDFYEKAYAKRIVLLIDDSKPGTTIFIDVTKGTSISKDLNFEPAFSIDKNILTVKLSKGPGSSDSFFRDLDVSLKYLDQTQMLQIEIKQPSSQDMK